MCDPVSIGLTLAGTALQAYGKSQVAGAMKHDIRGASDSYEAERLRQHGFQQTNTGTVADTLEGYSRPNVDQKYAEATASRGKDYVAPIQNKNFVVEGPADYSANSAVNRRNAATGGQRKSFSLGQALSKAKLDAFGDANQEINFRAADNSNRIATTNREAGGSQRAEAVQQGTLQSKLAADQGKGAVAGGLGDLFTTAGMIGSMSGGFGGLMGGPGSGLGGGLFGMGKPIGQASGPAFGWT